MNQKIRNLLVIILVLILAVPVLAQDTTTTPSAFDMNAAIAVGSSIVLAVLIGGAFMIALEAVKHLGISVPQSTFDTLGAMIIKQMQQSMQTIQGQVELTATPLDDIAYAVGRLPVDALIAELQNRGYGVAKSEPANPNMRAAIASGGEVQSTGSPINPNPLFMEGITSTEWDKLKSDDARRAKDVPLGYTLEWEKFDPNDMYAPPPEIHIKDESGGMKAELADRRGTLRLIQSLLKPMQPGQRYLLIVHGTADLHLKPDAPLSGFLRWQGRLLDADTPLVTLTHWGVDILDGEFAAQWALETSQLYKQLAVELELVVGSVHMVPFTDQSSVTIHSVELQPVDPNYGTNSLIRF